MRIIGKLILSLCLIFNMYCSNIRSVKHTNIKNSKTLAHEQEILYIKYINDDYVSESRILELEKNVWVKTAERMAPSNLVIRQYCLIDLLRNNPNHKEQINELVNRISYYGAIWAEGYTYWEYTKRILLPWAEKFDQEKTLLLIKSIDFGFVRTAYKRDAHWYPAPLGDLRDVPLNDKLQNVCNILNMKDIDIEVGSIRFISNEKETIYKIKSYPVGMNIHIPKDDYIVKIVDGIPVGFVFYTGIDNKYNSKFDEWEDLFDEKRIETIKSK